MNAGKSAVESIPVNTYQSARQIYNLSNIYLLIGDQTDEIIQTVDLRLLDPFANQDGATTYRLSLITAFQFAEGMADEAASDATRRRMDWKYALHLPVLSQGVTPQTLSEFRQNILSSQRALEEYDRFLCRLSKIGLYSRAANESLTACTVLVTVTQLTRLYQLYTGMRAALSLLSSMDSDWLRGQMAAHWFSHYKTGHLVQLSDLDLEQMTQQAQRLGKDVASLLAALQEQNMTALLGQAEIRNLNRILEDQFCVSEEQYQWRFPAYASYPGNFSE